MIETAIAPWTLKSLKDPKRTFALALILGLGASSSALAMDNQNDEDSVIRRSGDERDLDAPAPDESESGGPAYEFAPRPEAREPLQRPERRREDRDLEIELDDRFFADGQLRLSAFVIPFIDFDADKDTGEKNQDIHFEDSVRSGSGFGVRLGGGSSSKKDGAYFNLGLLYIFSQQETRNVRARVNAHQGYLDAVFGLRGGSKWISAYVEGAVAVGGVALDFKRGLDDEGGAAAMARLGGGVTFFQQLNIGASYGVLEFGYPTETIGRAQFISIEIKIDF